MPARSGHLYVHVPFCDGKCFYCAFYSVAWTPRAADAYLGALSRESDLALGAAGAPGAPATVYVGGGTPTALSAPQLRRLCALVNARIDPSRLREWTVEANPGTLTEEKADALRGAGVTRVSLGAQSFDDAVLRRAGRRHTAEDTAGAVALLRERGFADVGIDLIAGLPGESAAGWRQTLRRALALAPQHVSVYGLSVEEGTALHARIGSGAERRPSETAQRRALAAAGHALDAAGYERYEISNYARLPENGWPDAVSPWRCRHNVACWAGEDYLGLGPAACSRQGRRRWANRRDVPAYIRELRAGRPPPRDEERVSPELDVSERLMFAFRLREGVDLETFASRFGKAARALRPAWERTLESLARQGAAQRRENRWSLTSRGRDVADHVAAEIL